jgi:methylglutaconyl-CoA hydratase
MKFIKHQIKERIAYITLARPEKRNALNHELVAELKETLLKSEKDPLVKIIVLTGEGEAFCAGADLEYLKQLQRNSYEENLKDSLHLMELFKMVYQLKKIVVGQINGHAIAGGCGLASVCDISFASSEANFGYTEVKIGFVPAIVLVFLQRKIGEARTRELLLSGSIINAQTAKEYGLINFVVPPKDLEEEVFKYVHKLVTDNSAQSMELTKSMMISAQEKNLNEGLQDAAVMNAKVRETEDFKKGISSFLNKEKPKW